MCGVDNRVGQKKKMMQLTEQLSYKFELETNGYMDYFCYKKIVEKRTC